MNAEKNIKNQYYQDYRSLQSVFAEQGLSWCDQLREKAMDDFRGSGFPSLSDEQWKYTDLRPLTKHHFELATNSHEIKKQQIDNYDFLNKSAPIFVFVNGHFDFNLSSQLPADDALEIMPLQQAFKQQSDFLKSYLGRAITENNGITQLNTAMMMQGIAIHLKKDFQQKEPIQLLFISHGDMKYINHIRNLVVIENDASANIIESHVGLSTQECATTCMTEIHLLNKSQLDYTIVVDAPSRSYHLGNCAIKVGENSRLNVNQAITAGRLVRRDINLTLNATGSQCQLNSLSLAKERMHIDTSVLVTHLKPNSRSQQYFKSIVNDHARAIFNGRVVVAKGAYKTSARQINKNILLSDRAEVDSRPQLEIYEDDVQCSHGATVGQLDAEAINYLRSRLIDEREARAMLLKAFASDLVNNIPSKDVGRWCSRQLHNYLGI